MVAAMEFLHVPLRHTRPVSSHSHSHICKSASPLELHWNGASNEPEYAVRVQLLTVVDRGLTEHDGVLRQRPSLVASSALFVFQRSSMSYLLHRRSFYFPH
jgi:hypothetical protein